MKRLLFLSLGIFIATQTISTQLTARPFIIGVVGKIGAGKTTFASLLKKLLPQSEVLNADKNILGWNFPNPMIGSIDDNIAKVVTPHTKYLIIEGATVGIDEATSYETSGLIDYLIYVNTPNNICLQRNRTQNNHTYSPASLDLLKKHTASINHFIEVQCFFHADLTISGNGEVFNTQQIHQLPARHLRTIITQKYMEKILRL